MAKSEFIYVTYIKTNADELWKALTDPERMKQYWFGAHAVSEWTAGSAWTMYAETGQIYDAGEIIESTPPKRLVIKWQNEWRPELKAEGYSRCTFEIASEGSSTKLTVTHAIDKIPSQFIAAVSVGWPKTLSNLKSLLETGSVVLEFTRHGA